MAIYKNNKKIIKIVKNNSEIIKVYKGSQLIYERQ